MTPIIVILCGVVAVILLVLALRHTRRLALFLLITGTLAVTGIGAAALFAQACAAFQTAQAATEVARAARTASVSTVILAVLLAMMGTATVGVLAVAGLFWLRWKLATREQEQRRGLPRRRTRPALSDIEPARIIYVADDGDGIDLVGADLSQWGW
jgi:hypothetical protein